MILIALTLAAAAPADPVLKSRQAYAACLSEVTNDAIEKKTVKDAFLATLKGKCSAKEEAFRTALVAADKADGMSEQEAQDDAADQVSQYVDQKTEDFDDAK